VGKNGALQGISENIICPT